MPTRKRSDRAKELIEYRISQGIVLEKCSNCGEASKSQFEYVCPHCFNAIDADTNSSFNIKRPAEMQGRSVPIFTTWQSKVREP